LGEVPSSWAASAGVSVSIGCEPMAPADPLPTVPGAPAVETPVDEPAVLDLVGHPAGWEG
jgi:hypothetical protein